MYPKTKNILIIIPPTILFLIAILASEMAQANDNDGNRYFPATLTFDEPEVEDELTLPAWSIGKHPADGANVVDQNASWSFMRHLTPTLAIGADGGLNSRDWSGIRRFGTTQSHVTLKSEVYNEDASETLASASIAWGIAGSGSRRIGANAPNTLEPGVFFGKGFGGLPDNFAWLRPFAVTGATTVELPTAPTSINFTRDPQTGTLNPITTRNVPTAHWGLAIEYNSFYLSERLTKNPEKPVNQWAPLVEFAFDSPRGQKTAATMNPGLSYLAKSWEIAAEAIIPLNSQGGQGAGARVQLRFFLDDLMPSLFGKPLLNH